MSDKHLVWKRADQEHPIGMSQQFKCQRDNPRNVLYVQGSQLQYVAYSFTEWHGQVWDTDMSFTELNLRVCPNALLSQTQGEYHPQILFLSHFHRAPRPAVHSAEARRCHSSLDPRLVGIFFPEEL